MKKVLSILLTAILMFSMTACSDNNNQTPPPAPVQTPNTTTPPAEPTQTPSEGPKSEGPYKAALLLNGTLGDKSFFDSANDGLTKLRDELGKDKFDFKVEQMGGTTADEAKWEPGVLDYCETKEYDVIIVGTWQMAGILANASEQFPDQKFIFFDEVFGDTIPSNIYNVLYKQNEVSYLVGAAAALMTTDSSLPMIDPSNKVIGFLGGMENTVITDFLLGYIQGAKDIEPEISVKIGYVGDFVNSATGKDIALSQYTQGGVDVGFNVAGNAGLGQIEAAADAKKYAFGVDSDQALLLPDKAEYIPTSALKNVGVSLERAIKLDMEGSLGYGTLETLGFKENGVALVKDAHYEAIVPEAIRTKLDELEQKIISGEIVVDSSAGKTADDIKAITDSVK